MINLKKEYHNIEKIFKYLQLEEIEELGIMTFLNRDAIYVKAKKKSYLVNIKSLKNQPHDYQKTKITKIKSLEFFDDNGIHSIFPMKFNEKYFINYRNKDYEIYKYVLTEHKKISEINDKLLKKLANTQAIIHNLKTKLSLPSPYKEIKTKLEKKIKKLSKYSPKGSAKVYENVYQLDEIIKEYNKSIKYANQSLILGYDNYDLENIEWIKDYMYIIDYENCTSINPAVSLAEAAYYFSRNDHRLNFDTYKKYLSSYIKKAGPLSYDYKEALIVSQGKLLQQLEIEILNSIDEKNDYSSEIEEIVEEIKVYHNNIEKLKDIYLDIVKK